MLAVVDPLMNASQPNGQPQGINFCVYPYDDSDLWPEAPLSAGNWPGIQALFAPGYPFSTATQPQISGLPVGGWAAQAWQYVVADSGGTPIASSLCEVVSLLSTQQSDQNSHFPHDGRLGERFG